MTKRMAVALVLVAIALTAPGAPAQTAPAAHATLRAPAFTLPTAGGQVALDSLRGKVVYVDFWASWCEPCRRSFPWMRTLHERYGKDGLTVVAINLDKSRPAADAFLKSFAVPFTVAFDPAGKTAEAYRVSAMPTSFLVGPRGELLYAHRGFDPDGVAEIETRIRAAVGQ